MKSRVVSLALPVLTITAFGWQAPLRSVDRVAPNDNRVAAGTRANGVLTLHLEARLGRWFPDGNEGQSLVLPMFAEAGGPPQNPGPLIRVTSGTTIRVSIRNGLSDSTIV